MEPMIGFFILLIIAVPVVLLIVFIAKTNALASRVHWLEQELLRLRATLAAPLTPKAPEVTSTKLPVVEQRFTPPATAPLIPPPPVAPPMRVPSPPPELHVEEKTSRAREEWEAFVGGKLLNRIGALALIIGIGFFLKYAFDNNWITETMRVLLGGVVGVALLLLGARFHRKEFHVFAQGLIGAGVAILYLSVYASFNYYHLVSQTAAFILMSVVTFITFFHAFKYNSLAISLLGWAGGYLTPFMLSTGTANEIGLFTYIDILEAGLLAVVLIRQSWMILELLTLVGTYLTFSAWRSAYYSEDALLVTVLFLTLFWMLFYIADLYRIISKQEPHPSRQLVNILNAGIYYGYLYTLADSSHHEIMGLLTIVLAALYVLPALLAFRTNSGSPMLRDYIMTTVILTIIATAVQFSGFITVTLWSCEAFALMWCAQRWGFRYLAGAMLIFFLLIIGKLCFVNGAFAYFPIEGFIPAFNKRFLAFVALSVSMGASAYVLKSLEIANRELIRTSLHIGWCILIFSLVTTETFDFFSTYRIGATVDQSVTLEFTRNMTLLCIWTLYSLPLVYFGLRKAISPVLISGLFLTEAIFTIAIVWGISFQPIQDFRPLLNLRTLAFILVLSGSITTARWLSEVRGTLEIVRIVYPILLVGQALLFLVLLTGETRDIFERQMFVLREQTNGASIKDELRSIESMKQLSLSALWLLYGIALMIAGIWRRNRGVRILSIVILGISVLKIFVYDLSFLQTLYRIFSFMGLGLILLAASYMYQRYKTVIFGETPGKGADNTTMTE